ncbi:MAG: CBS domain-containing protein [Spirochaetes bacterium]|uniref:CBS domain-containing protein n=1 Tax=Candidatus Gallitreponema excrementavium TaxID=2840840 RepID=A0A9D9HN45_9SPIR|nr:CBS domain-containing protein [Candidatus Gallitreponema excrementavium]
MAVIPINTDAPSEAVLEILFNLKVRDVMSHPVLSMAPEDTMRNIQSRMRDNSITGIPIIKNEELRGIVSMDDIVTALDKGWIDEPAEAHMTKDVIVFEEDMPVSFCITYFNKHGYGRYPVINSENKVTGIVTATDVITALLSAMNQEVARLESKAREMEARISPETGINSEEENKTFEFKTEPFNFGIAGQASTEIKKILKKMGIDAYIIRRIGIASYELEINQVVHSLGGVMRYVISGDTLEIIAEDKGPGIPDLEKAMTEGFSTADERVRSLGFGAGMGLPNTKRVSDRFEIKSSPGKGTVVIAGFDLRKKQDSKDV